MDVFSRTCDIGPQQQSLWVSACSRRLSFFGTRLLMRERSLHPQAGGKQPYDGMLELFCFCRAFSPTHTQYGPRTVS